MMANKEVIVVEMCGKLPHTATFHLLINNINGELTVEICLIWQVSTHQ